MLSDFFPELADPCVPEAPQAPDLTSYDYLLVNTSSGKDSEVMLDHVCELADAGGFLNRIVAVHADLGRVEWAGVKELAERQARRYGIRFEVVKKDRDMLQAIEDHGKWPDMKNRFCTSDWKRAPVRTLMTRLADEFHGGPYCGPNRRFAGRPCRILNCIGLRSEESPKREKRPYFSLDHKNGRRHVDEWLPVKFWKEEEVWTHIRSKGLEYHPAYDLGMPRLSCIFCIFAPKPALVIAGRLHPELLDDYIAAEQRMGHTFRHKFSLVQIREAIAAGEDVQGPFEWPQCA